eukprot:5640730-Lingulodinium_polyedra.AAC.1
MQRGRRPHRRSRPPAPTRAATAAPPPQALHCSAGASTDGGSRPPRWRAARRRGPSRPAPLSRGP